MKIIRKKNYTAARDTAPVLRAVGDFWIKCHSIRAFL